MYKSLFFCLCSIYVLHAHTNMETVYLKNACNACHGMYGEGIGSTPRLQGKSKTFLLQRLRDLQHGKTHTAYGSVMISFAKGLNKAQTIAMAKYLASLKIRTQNDPNDDGGS